MGWNTSALFVRGRSIDDVLGFLPDVFAYEPTGQEVSADTAWSTTPGARLYLAREGDWCQLWDPDQRFPPRVERIIDTDGPGTLRGTKALAVLFSGVISRYALWLYDDGDLARHVCYHDGEPVERFGDPLPIEAEIEIPSWGPDEDFLWGVIKAVTGLTADIQQRFAVYDVVPD